MIKIREAKKEDLETMAKIGIACFPGDFKDGFGAIGEINNYNNSCNWFEARMLNERFARYHVAEENGEVLGYVFHQMLGGLSGIVQLEQIGVNPEHRRKGIGTTLIQESEKFWLKHLVEEFGKSLYKMLLTTSKDNLVAQFMYTNCGFEYEAKIKNMYWGNDEEIWVKEF